MFRRSTVRRLSVRLLLLAMATIAVAMPLSAQVAPRTAALQLPGPALAADAQAPGPVLLLQEQEARQSMPAWLKWGLVGGVATGTLAALLNGGSISTDPPSTAEAAATGFVAGFVIVGGSVALHQAVCRPGSRSRRNGLCGR
jgi:hypothetical protein